MTWIGAWMGLRPHAGSGPARKRSEDIRVRTTPEERAELWARYVASGYRSWPDFLLACARDSVPVVADARVLAGLSRVVAGLGGVSAALKDLEAQLQEASDRVARLEGASAGADGAKEVLTELRGAASGVRAEMGRWAIEQSPLRREIAEAVAQAVAWLNAAVREPSSARRARTAGETAVDTQIGRKHAPHKTKEAE